MDMLSEICSLLNVKDVHVGQLQMDGAWALSFPEREVRCMTLGAAIKGAYWLSVDGVDAPLRIDEGDCYLIAANVPYYKSVAPKAATHAFQPCADDDISPLSTSGYVEPRPTEASGDLMAGVRLVLDDLNPYNLLNVLPRVIHVRADSDSAPRLRAMLSALDYEAQKPRIGADAIINQLARMLFVHVLRSHIEREKVPNGWLGAVTDAKIGAALTIMHGDVSKRWTVDDLADAVGMSRSSFAIRFKSLVGQTPLDYWLHLRMLGAAQALRNSNKTVSSVALAWGYESEKSFGRAFRRVMGHPPTWYRKSVEHEAADSSLVA